MEPPILSVREIQQPDISLIIDYWMNAEPVDLIHMGVDLSKMPSKKEWQEMLSAQLSLPYTEKKSYAMIFLINGIPSGHCNVNKIIFGKEACMHLHIWHKEKRAKGSGVQLVKMCLPYFFENLNLDVLYCEPYAHNTAPNKALDKIGFHFVKGYTTTPGSINFEQPVRRWELTRKDFLSLTK